MYIAIKNGIDVRKYQDSRSTFILSEFGGRDGRIFKYGDLISLPPPSDTSQLDNSASYSLRAPPSVIPLFPNDVIWSIGIMSGPHESPDILTEENILVGKYIGGFRWPSHNTN